MFDAAALAAKQAQSPGRRPFDFKGMDGRQYQLPSAMTMSTRQAERLEGGDLSVLEEIAGDDQAVEAIRDMPIEVGQQLLAAWMRASGMEGKSPSPSSPTPRSGKRSRRR
ncbi:hypothetical protein [Streptomyces sp. bgisy153]|uniref:hypothetical protein n=1 Tax=Streptomyces sp. bgisy153 TaxID=3413793 RepID=UPI003D7239E3